MGLDQNGTKFMLYARSLGVEFARTAMIGRQGLHLRPSELARNLVAFGDRVDPATVESWFGETHGFADRFLGYLGAEEVHSFDHSDYEGATHTHDMNQAIPERFKGRYSVVLDGGSLEHVFNPAVALKNCMEMVQVGGHFLGITPTNNFMGHGFYQFSPELFFRVFAEESGFQIVKVIAFEDRPNATWFSVKDPKAVKGRVELINRAPTYLLVVARKTRECAVFQTTPQQSDYLAAWEGSSGDPGSQGAVKGLLKRALPEPLRKAIRKLIGLGKPRFDPRHYDPIDPLER